MARDHIPEPGDVWPGYCPICQSETTFEAQSTWFRESLICASCSSVPRERALMRVLSTQFPNWRDLDVHESSPADRGVSVKLRRECKGYIATQYDTAVPFGSFHPVFGYRSENLEAQTFEDASFDLVVTQDVFEHLPQPDQAIREIARTLRPGGAHIMSVPIVRKAQPSRRRARLVNGAIEHIEPPEYHGNPVDPKGSLVTVDWGYDIAAYLQRHSGMPTSIFEIHDLSQGIEAEYLDIVVSWRMAVPEL